MTDAIRLNRMQFYGYHGALEEERRIGQRFDVDVSLILDLYRAGSTDRLDQTVNYAEVYTRVKEIVEGPACALIEHVAEKIAETVLQNYSVVRECRVHVVKPNPPIAGNYDSVSVFIERRRTTAYLGLGSNMGDRAGFLKRALEGLQAEQGVQIVRCSSIYETDPYGPVEQADFLNMTAQIETLLPALALLKKLQTIEADLNRTREVHWGPRTIDLDLLLFGQEMTYSEVLSLPHPDIARRAFVLKPLAEIAPHLVIPRENHSVLTLWQNLNEEEGVRLWKQNNGDGEFGLFES
ncbi:2-amino-4-hydroxy-6-hydroxymethyldihydropteridine diphosphokinase [Sporolactobacillus terrae]|uniref:Bifunctional folate synthesis protein n=1 Tax=Sporolactobacillus terrae TaxID=269673 RepID=A0A5K7WUL9_9BACL|nr:2-amino-4-hydroxy-6-hydroxymethyldihydropteridine diphosphokinase [Sporolactobacillus terrae]UAK16020.1 2-amino-4-hydroxy-6-hydroxymethyldihydropteridine diphosphokinase [Sporolactobacillus terrae]BBN97379.1 bifunctional folate synthesis protein [Sporolactobacillus terrae]